MTLFAVTSAAFELKLCCIPKVNHHISCGARAAATNAVEFIYMCTQPAGVFIALITAMR
jgi:hypothetical protein